MKKTSTIAFATLLTVACAQAGETLCLNSGWRFTKAPKPIPLAQAKASVDAGSHWLPRCEVRWVLTVRYIGMMSFSHKDHKGHKGFVNFAFFVA